MKVALVALSGIAVRNPELVSLGVTLPGFVDRGKVIASLPSLGLLTIAGATPRDVELTYFEAKDVDAEQLADARFDLVAVSTFTAQAPVAYALLDDCRARGLRTAMGGLHATVLPDEAQAHADHVFVGEAEETWPEFLADLAAGRAKARYDATGRVFPFERAPLPRYDLLQPDRYDRLTVQSTRSCPHQCRFCASGVLLRGPYRKKPVDLVRRDVDAILARWPGAFLELADDDTFVDARYGLQLVETLRAAGVHWFTETDVSVADHDDLLDALEGSGCRQLLIGLEALDAAGVAELEDRAFKAPRVSRYAEAVRKIQARGVSVNGFFVLGADHQTPADVGRIVAFARDVGLAEVQVTVLTPFPGTPLHRELAAAGRLLQPVDWGCYTLFDVVFRPARMSVAELEGALRDALARLYAPDAVRARRHAFHAQVRAGRRQHGAA